VDQDLINEIEGFVTGGGRLAISLYPEATKPFRWLADEADDTAPKKGSDSKKEKKSGKTDKKKKASKKTRDLRHQASLKERWGLDYGFISATNASDQASNESALPLPETLPWHGGIVFTNLPST